MVILKIPITIGHLDLNGVIIMKKQLFFSLFSLISVTSVEGMEISQPLQPANSALAIPKSPEKSVRFTSNFKENYPYLTNKVYNDTDLKNYSAEQYVFNQEESIKSMNAAKARGANVYLTVGSHSQNPMNIYQATTLKRDPNIHGKVLAGLDTSPSKQTPKKGILLLGSANTTNSTWQHKPDKAGAQFNFESGIEINNDMNIIPEAYQMVKNQSPMKPDAKKTIIHTTPTKMSIYSSKDTNFNTSLSQRLNNAAERKGSVAVRSMTFSDQEVTESLSKLGKNAQLIVDYSALTGPGIPLLQQLHDAHVSVNVFQPQSGSRAKQHAKDVIIESEGKKIYINSTANITNQGNTQRNYQLYIPNNDQVTADAKEDFEKVKKETISFPEALKRKKAENEQKAEKRKFKKSEAKETALKKQKLDT